jgi:polyferredoxin
MPDQQQFQLQTRLQARRRWFQAGFFILFIFAPVFDMFRFDLNEGHFYLLGLSWTLGLEAFQQGQISTTQAVINLLGRGFVPLAVVVGGFIWTAWRWGRLYCGWLCPHYSVLEMINRMMQRASGKPSVWEKKTLPELQADGSLLVPHRLWWLPTIIMIFGFSLLWAVVLLTYLLPPDEIYHNLWHASLTRNQFIFIGAATFLLMIEFTLARHFFCRYGCAVGFFQSLSWMANRHAMVVDFDYDRSMLCKSCNNVCDNVCPMRLKPRGKKRHMFACTQCAKCITACDIKQSMTGRGTLLHWAHGQDALHQSDPPVGLSNSAGKSNRVQAIKDHN